MPLIYSTTINSYLFYGKLPLRLQNFDYIFNKSRRFSLDHKTQPIPVSYTIPFLNASCS